MAAVSATCEPGRDFLLEVGVERMGIGENGFFKRSITRLFEGRRG